MEAKSRRKDPTGYEEEVDVLSRTRAGDCNETAAFIDEVVSDAKRIAPSRNNSPRLKSPRRAASLIAMATKSGFCASLKSTTTIRSKLCRSLSDRVRRSMADLTTSTSKQPPSAKKTLPQAGQSGGASTIALVKSKSRPLRTLLAQTLLAQLASLFVVQYWAEFQIQDAVPV